MAINNLINDSWQGHSHGEVEDALKTFLSNLAQTLSNMGINYDALIEAITELQGRPAPASWAEAGDSKPSYNVSEIVYAVGKTLAQKLSEMDTAISQAGGSGITQQDVNDAVAAAVADLVGSAPTTLDTLGEIAAALKSNPGVIDNLLTQIGAKANSADVYTKSDVDEKVANAGKVKSVSVNGGTPSQPDAQGNVNIEVQAGAQGQKGDKGDTVVVGGEQEFTIVNDTTTGGASDALSAEMGKRVAGREATDRQRIDAIVAILKKSVFVDDQSTAIAALDALANATDSISIDKTSYLFNGVGGTLTLTAYTDPASKPVSWSSTDSSVATVSDGVVTAIAVGTATITATSGDKSATCAIQVQAFQVDSVTLNQSTLTSSGEVVGATHQLTATTSPVGGSIVWSSSNDSVATVDQTGLVTIVGNGTCTITATSGVESDSCAVSVSGVVHQYHINLGTLSNVSIEDGNGNAITDGQVITEGSTLTLVLVPASSHEITTASVTMGNVAQTLTDGTGGTKTVTLTVAGDIAVSATATYVRTNLLTNATSLDGEKLQNGSLTTGSGFHGKIVPVDLEKRYILKGAKNKTIHYMLCKKNSSDQYVFFSYQNDMPQGDDVTRFKNTNTKFYPNWQAMWNAKMYYRNYLDFKTPPSVNDGVGQLYLFIATSDDLSELSLYEWLPLADGSYSVGVENDEISSIDVGIAPSTGMFNDTEDHLKVIKLTPGAEYHFENYNLGKTNNNAVMALAKSKDNGYTFYRLSNLNDNYYFIVSEDGTKKSANHYTHAGYINQASAPSSGSYYLSSEGNINTPTVAQINDEGADLYLIVVAAYMANGGEGAGTFTLTDITE